MDAISVIIPVKDRIESTKNLLNKLTYQQKKYYPETEIIVIENNSVEDMSFLEEYENIVLKHETIVGVSHARNVGLDIAKGQYIAFIDNDDDIANDYLHQLYQAMRAENNKYDFCVIKAYSDNNIIYNYNNINLTNPIKQNVKCMTIILL